MGSTWKITGLKELNRRLKTLSGPEAKKVARQAIRKALQPVRLAVRSNAPYRTGQTRKAVKVKAARRKRDYIALNVQIGEGDYKGDQYYAAFVEYGYTRNGIIYPGQHFMKRAFDETAGQARATMIDLMLKGIEQLANK